MATPESMSFHNANALSERERVRLRIQQGTKASSPEVRSYRRQHLAIYAPHATLPDNSTGSKNRPFYATKDESHTSLEEKMKMRGGVLSTKEGQKYAQFILKRRAKDIIKQDLEAQGVEPSTVLPSDDLTLTPDESKSLELNTLLQSINDAVNSRDFSSLTITELKNIPRLMINTLPKMTQSKFAELVAFIEETAEEAEAVAEPKEDIDDDETELKPGDKATAGAERILRYLEGLLALLEEYAKVIGADEATKTATLKTLVSSFLGLRKTGVEKSVPRLGQTKVVDKRSAQPMASGEQRAVPLDANKPVLRRVIQPKPPKPIAPPPPPPQPEAKEEAEEDSTAPPPRRLTAQQLEFERKMDNAYKMANSKVATRKAQGLAELRAGAIALGKKVPAGEVSRTKLKNLIEKGTPYVIG